MTYHMAIGDRTYSSWSLRGWLLLERSIKGCSTPISWPHSRGAIEATPAPSASIRTPR